MLIINPVLTKFNSTLNHKQSAKSVRMKCTLGEKKKVIAVFKDHENFYKEFRDLYFQHNDRIGKDSISYTTDQIIEDIHIKLRDWANKPSNDIFESYVIRHNKIILDTAEQLNKKYGYAEADEFIDRFYICYNNNTPPTYKPKPAEMESLFV